MRKSSLLLTILLALFLFVMPVLAADIVIDGVFGDWAGLASVVDSGGADDESSPTPADITEYRADSDGSGLYMLMAWDDTAFQHAGSRAGITIRGQDGQYYRLTTVVRDDPPTVALNEISIFSCGADPTCGSTTSVCTGSTCTGLQYGVGSTWVDPFAGDPGHGVPAQDCSDPPECTSLDTAVEIHLPWTFIGGIPDNGEFVFLQFYSNPSGSGQAVEDGTGTNGISCRNNNGTFSCYPSTPTAVDLVALKASSKASLSGWGLLLFAGVVGSLSAIVLRRRSWRAN